MTLWFLACNAMVWLWLRYRLASLAVSSVELTVGISPRCSTSLQDLQDRMKKEAKKEMDERGALQRDEALAAREDEDYQV